MSDEPFFGKQRRELVLPVHESDFAKFLASLLGKPQTIEGRLFEPFDLGKQEIENIFHIVDHRVSQQNKASLVQFSVRITYQDSSSVLLNSLEDFLQYREIRHVVSTSVNLSWTYLIKFEQSDAPEKQVIELTINTDPGGARIITDEAPFDVERIRRINGHFFYRIQHTARTWGTDIENLLRGQIQGWKRQDPFYMSILNRFSGWISFSVAFVFIALFLYGLYIATQPPIAAFKLAVIEAQSKSADAKLDFILGALVDNPALRSGPAYTAAVVIGIILFFIIAMSVESITGKKLDSFLVLSEAAKKHREEALRERKWTLGYFALSVTATTIAGVLSRYIFALIM